MKKNAPLILILLLSGQILLAQPAQNNEPVQPVQNNDPAELTQTAEPVQPSEPLAAKLAGMVKSDVFNIGVIIRTESHFWVNNDSQPSGRRFDLGATRLDFRGRLDGNFTYRVHFDLRLNPSIMNAEFGYRYADQHRVVVGAFKPFTSTDLDPAPSAVDFIGRARLVGAMMNLREIGVTFLGNSGALNYRVGIYNGTGLTRQNDDRFMYTARLGYTIDIAENDLEIGLNTFLNQTQNVNVGNTGLTSTGNRVLYGGYFRFNGDRFFVTAEASQTQFDAVQLAGAQETITGFFGTVAFQTDDKNEVLLRLDHLSYDVRDIASNLLILGLNHRATKLVKIQVNGLFRVTDNANDNFGLLTTFQVAF